MSQTPCSWPTEGVWVHNCRLPTILKIKKKHKERDFWPVLEKIISVYEGPTFPHGNNQLRGTHFKHSPALSMPNKGFSISSNISSCNLHFLPLYNFSRFFVSPNRIQPLKERNCLVLITLHTKRYEVFTTWKNILDIVDPKMIRNLHRLSGNFWFSTNLEKL